MATFKQLSTTQTFIGLSTETKPTSGVNYGARFYEVNAATFKVDKIYHYVPDSDGAGTSGWVQYYVETSDANLQVNHAAVSNSNPVPISDAGGSVTVDVGTALPAGTAIVGKVGIDQTTDGTTNKVAATQATHDNFNANANIQVGDADVSSTNPVPIKGGTVANTTKISPTGGSKTVTTAGTAEALVASETLRTMLYVRAKSTNTGDIYLGDSAVDKTTSQQIVLDASQEITIEAPAGYCLDINEFYIDSSVNDEGVDFLYV